MEELVAEIKNRYKASHNWAAVGREYGVGRTIIWRIVHQGYEPKDNKVRRALGLPEIIVHMQRRDEKGRFL